MLIAEVDWAPCVETLVHAIQQQPPSLEISPHNVMSAPPPQGRGGGHEAPPPPRGEGGGDCNMLALKLQQFQDNQKKNFLRRLVFPIAILVQVTVPDFKGSGGV